MVEGTLLIALRDLGSARDVQSITAIVGSAARSLTGADGATFVLRDGDLCHYADEDAITPLWKGQRFPMSVCVSGWCMLHREQVVIEDIYSDARIPADTYRPTFVKSLAMVPVGGDDPVGAIGAYWAGRHAASRDELAALQALADAAAVSLANAVLYEQLQAARAEADRRASQATSHLAAIVEGSDSAIIGVSLDGCIVSWNSAAGRMLGYAPEQARGRRASVLYVSGGEAELARILERIRRQEGVGRVETGWRRADGSAIIVQVTVSPIRDAVGSVVAASLIAHDATARKRAEEALETANEALRFARDELEARVEARTADLSRARRDLETLLYIAAHDLKEPLNGLLLCSGMLGDRYRDQLDDKGRGIIDRIGRAAGRMGRLLDDLLVLTRAGNLSPGTEAVPAATIVGKVLERFNDRIRASGARIKVDAALPSLYAHPTWAAEAVAHLISNALKFTRDHQAPEIEIAPYAGLEGRGICVRDRGPGVPLELQERIFKIFQRGVGREIEGTGAGLAITREIARRHGGEAFMRTRAGGGSEFVVTFGPKPARPDVEGITADHAA